MYRTLIIFDNEQLSAIESTQSAISFDSYLKDYPKLNEPKTRIINLCDTEYYLSKGYYCSLLAEARSHRVLPSVKTINELRTLSSDGDALLSLRRYIGDLSETSPLLDTDLMIYFGKAEAAELQKLAAELFRRFGAPLLRLRISRSEQGLSFSVARYSYAALSGDQRSLFLARLDEFTKTVWRTHKREKRQRWDMAILVDPKDPVPPSSKEALSRFVKAGAKLGIHAELLTIEQLPNIAYYDALFIRETTAIDHYTYRLASRAENKGLVVMDDPTSILRCCNKVYLHDAFNYQKVPSLRTEVVSECDEAALDRVEADFAYPVVLKMPEGSFSKGVFKVKSRDELRQKWQELLKESALILVQEYLYTEFDWRIGVLNGRAIYACRYLMARNHWQIYNHGAKRHSSGGFETLPTFEVPKSVLDAALKAAKIIGNGLYGVDIKEHDNRAYVIEVNDNPSIDYKVEDAYLGDELYMQIMGEFHRRLEARGR